MLLTWAIRILLLVGALAIHWALGAFLTIGLYFHMKGKARRCDERCNLGGNVIGENGRPIRAPWYLF